MRSLAHPMMSSAETLPSSPSRQPVPAPPPALGRRVHELHPARVLVGGHALLGPPDDVLRGDVALLPFAQDDHGLHRLAAALVGHAYDARLLHGRVPVEEALDLGG